MALWRSHPEWSSWIQMVCRCLRILQEQNDGSPILSMKSSCNCEVGENMPKATGERSVPRGCLQRWLKQRGVLEYVSKEQLL